jgi:D-mannonate dehydratase
MEWINKLDVWREDRRLVKPQWASLAYNLESELQELREAFAKNDKHEIIDAFADIIIFSTNHLRQLGETNIMIDLKEDKPLSHFGLGILCDHIGLNIKALESLVAMKLSNVVVTLLKLIISESRLCIESLGYNFNCVMDETVKEISSRQQDPEQKVKWSTVGSQGEKWQKWKEQPKETLYKADYNKCKGLSNGIG